MHTFSALMSGVNGAGNTGTSRGASPSSASNGDDRDAGGFDRMLQAQSRPESGTRGGVNASSSFEKAQGGMRSSAADKNAERPEARNTREAEPSREPKASDAGKKASKTDESRPRDGAERERADASGNTAAKNSETAPDAATANADDSAMSNSANAPATLPEQLLALLNGLASPAAGPATNADATALLPSGSGAASPSLSNNTAVPGLQMPLATASTTPASAQTAEADPTAFAMAMVATAPKETAATDATSLLDAATASDSGPAPLPASPAAQVAGAAPKIATPTVAMQSPLAMDAQFDDGFGSRIAWMAEQRVGHAEIRVSPDHLGTIDVRLQLDGTRVSAEFHSANADVRHALESSLPRLREMLGQSGLQLGHADVGQRQAQQQGASNGQAGSFGSQNDHGETVNDTGWSSGPAVRATRGLLDEYA